MVKNLFGGKVYFCFLISLVSFNIFPCESLSENLRSFSASLRLQTRLIRKNGKRKKYFRFAYAFYNLLITVRDIGTESSRDRKYRLHLTLLVGMNMTIGVDGCIGRSSFFFRKISFVYVYTAVEMHGSR